MYSVVLNYTTLFLSTSGFKIILGQCGLSRWPAKKKFLPGQVLFVAHQNNGKKETYPLTSVHNFLFVVVIAFWQRDKIYRWGYGFFQGQDHHSGGSLGCCMCNCTFLSLGCMVTATIMNKNRPVRLIFNWYISKIHPLCSQNIAIESITWLILI